MKKYCLAALALCYIACGSPHASHDGHDHDHEAAHPDGHSHTENETHSDHDGHDHAHDEHDGHDHEAEPQAGRSDEIIFTPEQAAMGIFELSTVGKTLFAPVIKASGQIISSPADFRNIVAPSAGTVVLDKNISEGSYVAAGAPLLYISSKNMADGETFARAKAEYDYALAQWERAEKLIGERIITRTEYEQAKKDYDNAARAFHALKGTEDNGISVRAPFAGYVKSVDVTSGAFADKGAQLLSLVKSNRSRLRVDIPQKYFPLLDQVTSAVFSTESSAVHDTDSLRGKVISYSKSVTPSGLLTLTLEYDGVADIPEGAFVEASLRLKDRKEAITIPLSAVTEEQGTYFVYVQLDEEGYQKRPVTLGQNDGLRAEVLDGLHGGETLVTQGAYRVKLASASGAIPHGHEH